ncbi:MAG: hypothetical protein Fur0018_20910 [Anaerolineales bacterium]
MTLAQRSVRSAGYTIASSGLQAVVQFVRAIILARLLLPQHFGVYAYASSFVLLTSALPNFGMGAALIHRTRQSEGEIARRVHFTLLTLFSLLWGIVLALTCTWFLAPENRWVLWVVLGSNVISNLSMTGAVTLARQVAFRRVAVVQAANTLLGSSAAIFLAWNGVGLWSLVITDVISAVVVITGYYLIRPVWRPRFGWDRGIGAYLLGFGRRNMLAIVLLQALDHIDDLWTGAFLGKTALGFYSRAYTFATYPRKLLASPVNQVATSTYAALKEQPKRLSQAFFRVNALLIRSGFFIAGLLFLLAPEFIHFVIGDKWLPMMTTFRLMLVYTLLDPIKVTIGNVFIAMGEPEKVVRARAWQMVIMLGGLFTLGNLWGIEGVALTADIMLIAGIGLLLWQVRVHVQFSLWRLFGPPLLALGVGLGAAGLTRQLAYDSALLTQVAWKSIAFMAGYLLPLGLMEHGQWRAMLATGINLLKPDSQPHRTP